MNKKKYKFIIIGDTNDGDYGVIKNLFSQDELNNIFKSINLYIDKNGDFCNHQDYKDKWAKICEDKYKTSNNKDAEDSFYEELIGKFIPYVQDFAHTIKSVDVFVERQEDFENFKESKEMAQKLYLLMNQENVKKYLRKERSKRIF